VDPSPFDDRHAAKVEYIESVMTASPTESTLTVFEQQFEDEAFAGIRRISPEATHA